MWGPKQEKERTFGVCGISAEGTPFSTSVATHSATKEAETSGDVNDLSLLKRLITSEIATWSKVVKVT